MERNWRARTALGCVGGALLIILASNDLGLSLLALVVFAVAAVVYAGMA
jgi:hypothetical protein